MQNQLLFDTNENLSTCMSTYSLNCWKPYTNLLSTHICLEREVFGSLMEQLMINTGESELEVS